MPEVRLRNHPDTKKVKTPDGSQYQKDNGQPMWIYSGANPEQAKRFVDKFRRTGLFVVPTLDYVFDPYADNSTGKLTARVKQIVADHKEIVRHWEIGNEWWLAGNWVAPAVELRRRYAEIALEIIKTIKEEDSGAYVYLTGDWNTAGYGGARQTDYMCGEDTPETITRESDFVYFRNHFETTGHWRDIAGVTVHVYTGPDPTWDADRTKKPPSATHLVSKKTEEVAG